LSVPGGYRSFALSGVPGTGKSRTARELGRRYRVIEVAELARQWGLARADRGGLEVDLTAVRRRFRDRPPDADVIVGHLAHLLPIRDVIVLRCRPLELLARLRRARRGTPEDRHANFVAEALDVVLVEALGPGRRVWEIDTTRRSPGAVARAVRRTMSERPPPRRGTVDWLADPSVTAHLLDRPS
jgi:adenylate kinase